MFCRQFVEFFKHGGVILPGCAVDGEHPAGVAHAQRIDAGQQKVQVACQGRDVGDLFKVRLPIQHSLIQVRHAPPLGNVEPEGGGQLCRGGGGHGVAPGAERNQQVPVFIKGKVAVHHGGNTDAAHGGQRRAVLGLHIGRQRRIGGLHTLPDFLHGVGPDAVLQAVFPSEIALRKGSVRCINQNRLDAGGAKLHAEGTGFQVNLHEGSPL